jgi:hypothetical protein
VIRLTWLQFRLQAVVALAVLALLAIPLAITGPHLAHLYRSTVANCAVNGNCKTAGQAFLQNDRFIQSMLSPFLLIVPGLIGIFWGAPLIAREIETGTYRLAWTQSVTRKRWLAIKVGVVGLASAITAGLLSIMATWWSSPIDRVNANRFNPPVFDVRGIVPIGYALFAFALGVTVGLLIPRILPAMATTLALFIGVRIAEAVWVRPHLLAPVKQSLAFVWGPGAGIAQGSSGGGAFVIPPTPNLPNAWIYSNAIVDQAGHAPSSQFLQSTCPALTGGLGGAGSSVGGGVASPSPGGGPTAQQVQACVAAIGEKFHQVVTYQPADRYWVFQSLETATFIGLSLLLTTCCFLLVRRRLA